MSASEMCASCSVVPRGANNMYNMPVDVTFWGQPDTKAEVLTILRKHGYVVYEGQSQVPANSTAAKPVSNDGFPFNVPTRRTFLNPTEVFS